MKLGLNGSTTDQCNLLEDITVASQAGFDLLELRTYKIIDYLESGGSLEDLKKAFKANEIQPYAINALEFFTLKKSAEDTDNMLKEAKQWLEIAASINCPYLVAVPSRYIANETDEEVIEDAVNMLQRLSQLAEKYKVKIAFEFIGFDDFSVRTLKVANQIVEKVDSPYIGLVVDTYHFYIGGSSLGSVSEVNKENVFIFHINDAEKGVAKIELNEDHRVFPGIGEIPLKEIGQAFKLIGYNEMVSLELFRKDYWKMEANILGDEAFKHVQASSIEMFK